MGIYPRFRMSDDWVANGSETLSASAGPSNWWERSLPPLDWLCFSATVQLTVNMVSWPPIFMPFFRALSIILILSLHQVLAAMSRTQQTFELPNECCGQTWKPRYNFMPYMYIAFSTLMRLVSGLLVCREERKLHEKFFTPSKWNKPRNIAMTNNTK